MRLQVQRRLYGVHMPPISGDFITQCGHAITAHGPLLWVLFMAGLTGSFVHCLPMCGGFVLGQLKGDEGRLARLLVPYHMGRLTTYVLLGAVAASGMMVFLKSPGFLIFERLILASVAMLFFFTLVERLSLFEKLGLRLPFRLSHTPMCAVSAVSKLAKASGWGARFFLGLGLGLLPCGLLFAALLLVATTANPWAGALGMIAFGAGTVPALMALSLGSRKIVMLNGKLKDFVTLGALGVNGLVLLVLAAF